MLYFTSGSTGRPKAVVHRYLQTISGFGVTHALMVPTLIQAMLTEQAASGVGAPQLRQIAYGASPITSSLLKVAMERFSCSFIQCYGSTEAGGVPTMLSAR